MGVLKFLFRVVLWAILVVLILASWAFWQTYSHQNSQFTGTADCAVVFGAAVWRDDIPSHALSDRMQSAIGLYKNDQVECLILSGGKSTFGAHEVDVMAKMAQEYNIPLKDIVRDMNGINTSQTLLNLEDPTETSYVMVSQAPHLGRIAHLSRRIGIQNYALHVAIPIRWQRQQFDNFFKNEVLKNMYYAFWISPKK